MADEYVVFEGRDGQWYFHRMSDNHEVVATSEGYPRRETAEMEAHREADPAGLNVRIAEA